MLVQPPKPSNTPVTDHKNQPPSESVKPDATAEDEAHDAKEKLPPEVEEAVRKLTVQAFRINYLFGQTELKGIISTGLVNTDATVIASFDEDNLHRLATRRIRGYVKNWINTMPHKKTRERTPRNREWCVHRCCYGSFRRLFL